MTFLNEGLSNISTLIRRRKGFWTFIIILTLLLEIPFVFISFPPSTDLPQHVGQINLFFKILSEKNNSYTINWFGPNTLIYIFLFIVRFLTSSILCGKIFLMILVFFLVSSTVYLGRYFNRPFENIIIVSLLFFNLCFYWGLINFLIGWPVFIFWIIQVTKSINLKNWFILVILSGALFLSHLLWFAIAFIWLFLCSIFTEKDLRKIAFKISAVFPFSFYAIIWLNKVSNVKETVVDTVPVWGYTFLQRINPFFLVDSMLGGVKGSFEYFIASIIVLWILLGLFTNLGQIKEKINFYLLTCFVFFVLTFIFSPDKYLNTLFLSQRWFPFAIIFLIIALPNPRFSKEIVLLSLFFLLIIFSTATAKIWSEYEKKELAGLSYSLNKIPVGKKVLGLDFIKNSTYIKGRPFLNIFAYALVLRENEINSSFVSHPVELLTNKVMKINKVTPGLEWFPENFSNEDFRYFDYVLINGGGLTHAIFAKQSFLDPITKTGRWRLYSVLKNKGYKFSLQ